MPQSIKEREEHPLHPFPEKADTDLPNNTQIYAFEPIPANYSVLVRNLFNTSSDSVKAGACPQPVALRVALGAEQGEEEFHFFEDNPGESTRWATIGCCSLYAGKK